MVSKKLLYSISLILLLSGCQSHNNIKPNILWIVAEDLSPYLGCYGDANATTPNLDKLASRGVVYTNAFANAPVCAPARSTIITGMYPPGLGTEHMRSQNAVPDFITLFPGYLRNQGYYCSNNNKKDYNLVETEEVWNESSRTAHYKNRRQGQPFFAVFNLGVCHESCIHKYLDTLAHDPKKMVLPPYHPDLPDIRHDWAQFYDKITMADKQVGDILKELEESGLADSTIVFFYGDNGGILGRSKRFLYETGLRVPLIVYVPEMFKSIIPGKSGSQLDRMVSFIDLAPTVLNIAGILIPEYMQGTSFLGPNQHPQEKYVHTYRGRMDERYDFSRGTFSKKYHYIVNYMPHRIYAQHVEYLWQAPSMQAWEKAYNSGQCNAAQSRFWQSKPVEELYDRTNDPWEVNNLADDPGYQEVLEEMREETQNWMLSFVDAGFMPEGEMIRNSKGSTIYDYARTDDYPLEEIMKVAWIAIQGKKDNIHDLKKYISSNNSFIRYWAAQGGIILKKDGEALIPDLKELLDDPCPEVGLVAAEALYGLGLKDIALKELQKELYHETPETVLFALNILQSLGKEALTRVHTDLEKIYIENKNNYVNRATKYALETIERSGA